MKNIQMKYNLLHIFYWFAVCSLGGFAAIFLSAKGLSNTLIGTVTGGACLLTIIGSTVLSSLCAKLKKVSIQQFLAFFMVASGLIYMLIAFMDLPVLVLMVLYMLIYCVSISLVPLLSTISMNYIAQGENVNFGLSRGMGSVSYALAAVILSQICTRFSPMLLSVLFFAFSALFMLVLFSTPKTYAAPAGKKSGSLLSIPGKYKAFMVILTGFALMFACSTALSTYLVNIIHNLGGSDSMYGIAIFFMAASEMPVMAFAPKVMKKTGVLPLIAAAAIFYIIRNTLIVLSPSLPVLIAGMLFQGVSYGLMTAVITYYVSMYLDVQDQVMGQTMIAVMTTGVGSMLGNVAGGAIIDTFGLPVLYSLIILVTIAGSLITVAGVIPGLRKEGKVARLSGTGRPAVALSTGK